MELDAWLRKAMEGERGAKTRLARDCGVTWLTIHNLARGKHVPSLELAMKVHEATGGEVTLAELRESTRKPEKEGK